MADHIEDIVPDLLVRRADDPVRVAALQHAHTCGPCARAWQESSALFAALGLEPVREAPSSAALARTLEEVRRSGFEGTPIRLRAVGALGGLVALLCLVPLSIAALGGGARAGSFAVAGALGFLAAGAAILCLLRPRGVVVLPLASLAMAVAFAEHWALAPDIAHSFKCARLELIMALVPAAALLVVLRSRSSGFVRSKSFAGFAGAGALAGQAVLHVMCPMEPSLSHQLVFHVAPLALAMALAAAWNARRNVRALR